MGSPQRGNTCEADNTLLREGLWKGKVLQRDTLAGGSEKVPGHTAKHWSSFVLKVGLGRGKALRQESKGSFWCCPSSVRVTSS